MRTSLMIFLAWLHQLALSVWLGGIFVLGAIVPPALFGLARRQGQTHWGEPLYTFAGTAISDAFGRFNYAVLVAGALMVVCGVAYGSLSGLCTRRLAARALLTAVAWGISLWLTFMLFPQMIQARMSEIGRASCRERV